MSVLLHIPDIEDIDEALAEASAATQGGNAANDDIEILAGGVSKKLMEAIQKKAAEEVAKQIQKASIQAGILAGLTEAAANDDTERLAEEMDAQSQSLEGTQPTVNNTEEKPGTGKEEQGIQKESDDESEEDGDETPKAENSETPAYGGTPTNQNSPSAPQDALDNFGEDSDEDDEENDSEDGDEDDEEPENFLSPDDAAAQQRADDLKKEYDKQKADEAVKSGDHSGVDPDDLAAAQQREQQRADDLKKEYDKQKADEAVKSNPDPNKKAFDQFDEDKAKNAENNPDNVPGGAHQEHEGEGKEKKGDKTEGDESNGSEEEGGQSQQNPKQPPSKGMLQKFNERRYKPDLEKLNSEIQKMQKTIDRILMPPIRRLNKAIKKAEKKIKKLTRKIWYNFIVGWILIFFSFILMITIIFIPAAATLEAISAKMLLEIPILKAEKTLLKGQIKPKIKERDKKMKEVIELKEGIKKRAAYRNQLLNNGLFNRKPKMK